MHVIHVYVYVYTQLDKQCKSSEPKGNPWLREREKKRRKIVRLISLFLSLTFNCKLAREGECGDVKEVELIHTIHLSGKTQQIYIIIDENKHHHIIRFNQLFMEKTVLNIRHPLA